ncbi:hypothetical protein PYCCODRAFT_1041143 [Trametes coccinea BRFM310]|uniref:Uncharacterized protein n=1 Tax=Trametes coccinea (strain BRFM310) TaxID=1353009 RepID=A0A1Y2IA57_TRAC3|nr:hypothetical protein PYCCODRAFT_1041143 [Trametes coccinea BRFM310]
MQEPVRVQPARPTEAQSIGLKLAQSGIALETGTSHFRRYPVQCSARNTMGLPSFFVKSAAPSDFPNSSAPVTSADQVCGRFSTHRLSCRMVSFGRLTESACSYRIAVARCSRFGGTFSLQTGTARASQVAEPPSPQRPIVSCESLSSSRCGRRCMGEMAEAAAGYCTTRRDLAVRPQRHLDPLRWRSRSAVQPLGSLLPISVSRRIWSR